MAGTFIDAFEDRQPDGMRLSVWDRGGFTDLSWDDWRSRAEAAAAALRDMGIGAGARVGCILTNAPSTCAAAIGVWLAGGCVVSLPTIGRGMDALEYIRSLRRMCAESGTQLVLAEGRYAEQLAQAELEVPVAAYESLAGGGRAEPAPPGAGDVGFIQYSSGSTSTPKGCALTMRAITAQLDMLAGRLDLQGPHERGVSWLPLSHDMGFFGCLMLSFAKGMPLTLGTPGRYLRSPRTWLEDCVRTAATITAVPNSGLRLGLDAVPGGAGGRFRMRKLVIGGERVEESVLQAAVDVLGPAGLRRRDLLPAYGLAEAALAVTMPLVEEEPRVVHLRTDALLQGDLDVAASGDRAGATPCVSLGPPLDGVSLAIEGEGIGEILIDSPSLAEGYVGNPQLTAERFVSGTLRTGDLGFLDGGELFVVGRMDDMLCLGGRNVFATDVESDLGALRGVRPGTPVLVEVPDGEAHRVVILAEPETGSDDLEQIAEEMAVTAARVSGIRADECLLLPPGAVPKTPSGKVQRFRARQLLAEGGREAVARVSF